MRRLFILGADDAEMRVIERLLEGAHQDWVYAQSSDGRRIGPADAAAGSYRIPRDLRDVDQLVLVELAPKTKEGGWAAGLDAFDGVVVVVDHHTPTVPAPSILQVAGLLQDPTVLQQGDVFVPHLTVVGVADHDLQQAYACWPHATAAYRRGQFTAAEWEAAEAWVNALPIGDDGQPVLYDPAREPSPSRAVADVLLRRGWGVFAPIPSDREGYKKFALVGATRAVFAKAQALANEIGVGVYAYPERGLLGFYMPQ